MGLEEEKDSVYKPYVIFWPSTRPKMPFKKKDRFPVGDGAIDEMY